MYLRKNAVGAEVSVEVMFEKVAEDLLMVSLITQTQPHGILSYWRLVKVSGVPPLEIGVDYESQSLAGITFFIEPACIKQCECSYVESAKIDAKKGSILVDVSIFSKTNDYIDIAENHIVCIKDTKLICLFEEMNRINQSYRTDRLEVYLDVMSNVVGFAICDLSVRERNILKSL